MLEVKTLSKHFGGVKAVDGLDLRVERGEIFGLIGPNGSGKSTLFEWLTGAIPDPSLAHSSQSAMAAVPDERVGPLCKIYQPKKW